MSPFSDQVFAELIRVEVWGKFSLYTRRWNFFGPIEEGRAVLENKVQPGCTW